MFSNSADYFDQAGKVILKLIYPHEHNDHRPWLLRSHSLLSFLLLLISLQVLINIATSSRDILGFATNISISEIIRLTNEERKAAGMSLLKENNSLDQAASYKAVHMFERDYWDHFAPDGTSPWYFFGLVGYKYTWAGENLARDFATSGGVVDAWMASSGHRANILNANFKEVGIAVVNGNLKGEDTTLVVQLFGNPTYVAAAPSGTSTQGSSSPATGAKVETRLEVPSTTQETESSPVENTASGNRLVQDSSGEQSSFQLPLATLVRNTTSSQKVTIALLLVIAALFIFDSLVIFRKRQARASSHSFAHASMIILLIIASLLYGQGTIL